MAGTGFLVSRYVILAVLTISATIGVCSAEDESKVIRVIATGKAESTPVTRAWILVEPSLDGIIVPTREWGGVTSVDIIRLMRIYFPRTFEDLISYDFLLLTQVDMGFISPEQATWMYRAIAEYGLGGANTRSVMSMNAYLAVPWGQSILSDAFPNNVMAVVNSPHYSGALSPSGPLIVNDDESIAPVVRPLKRQLERIFPGYGGLMTIPREGSRIHTWVKTNLPVGGAKPGYVPHIFEWDYAEGITFTFMDMVYDNFWKTNINPYALDIITNVIWHGSHRQIPEDTLKVHTLRDNFRFYSDRRLGILAVFDFAESFGANAASLYSTLGDLDVEKAEADGLYLSGDFDASYAKLGEAMEKLVSLSEEALKLKDQALLWVYVIEWLSVAAASLVCGATLWLLMVRRGLYREVGVTRGDDGSGRTEYR
jgi:hypothetical protein